MAVRASVPRWPGGVVVADVLVGLADAIEALRAELTRAMGAGAGKPMRFALDPIELTLQVAITNEGNGKIGWKVIEFGGKREAVTTQTLVLRLTPKWRDADGSLTSDFTIAGAGEPGQHFGPRPEPATE